MREHSPVDVSTKLQRVAELARDHAGEPLTNLAHHIDIDFLKAAFRRTRKDGATGVDGQTASEYAANLEVNLQALLERFKSGLYRAPPVRRVHIPKGDGKETRPIGIPTFEDKVLQRAVTMILEAVYEQEFLNCSYGFRPGRSVHMAIQALWQELMVMRGGWVLEVDIKKFYDSIDHSVLREFLDQRVRDGVLRRAIGKWLKAGVLEEGVHVQSELGTPQGGVVSPVLANIYLHEVVDKWFESEVKPRMRGHAALIRYADDLVAVFEHEDDAKRVLEVLSKRLGRFGLTLHPEKTRLVQFVSPAQRRNDDEDEPPAPGSFDFLGFRHHWGRSLKGAWVVKRKTAPSRFTRALRKVTEWIHDHRYLPIVEQHKALSAKLRGHYGFYGITGNSRALARFAHAVDRVWWKWLNRRSQRKTMPWARFNAMLKRHPLPPPRVIKPIRSAASP